MENNPGLNSEVLSTSEQYGVLPATRAGGTAEAMYPGSEVGSLQVQGVEVMPLNLDYSPRETR